MKLTPHPPLEPGTVVVVNESVVEHVPWQWRPTAVFVAHRGTKELQTDRSVAELLAVSFEHHGVKVEAATHPSVTPSAKVQGTYKRYEKEPDSLSVIETHEQMRRLRVWVPHKTIMLTSHSFETRYLEELDQFIGEYPTPTISGCEYTAADLRLADRFHEDLLHAPTGHFLDAPYGLGAARVRSRLEVLQKNEVQWSMIKKEFCRWEAGVGPFTLRWSRSMVYVKLGRRRLRNLTDYASLVKKKVISRDDSAALILALCCLRKQVPRGDIFNVDNEEVGVLHFRIAPRQRA